MVCTVVLIALVAAIVPTVADVTGYILTGEGPVLTPHSMSA
jgi:hypothetical protein